jgi:hypothetical protein
MVSHAAYSGENRQIAFATGMYPSFDLYEEYIDYKEYLSFRIFNSRNYKQNRVILSMYNESDIDNFLDTAGWFHSMSTNLYDEEIQAIYGSDGMIGISFDERALGGTAYNYDIDTLKQMARELAYSNYKSAAGVSSVTICKLKSAEPFVRNMFAIVQRSGCTDVKMWKHICIGTDFDGVINPINVCRTAADIPEFYELLVKHFDFYMRLIGIEEKMLCGLQPKEILNMIFYKNLEEFTIKHF